MGSPGCSRRQPARRRFHREPARGALHEVQRETRNTPCRGQGSARADRICRRCGWRRSIRCCRWRNKRPRRPDRAVRWSNNRARKRRHRRRSEFRPVSRGRSRRLRTLRKPVPEAVAAADPFAGLRAARCERPSDQIPRCRAGLRPPMYSCDRVPGRLGASGGQAASGPPEWSRPHSRPCEATPKSLPHSARREADMPDRQSQSVRSLEQKLAPTAPPKECGEYPTLRPLRPPQRSGTSGRKGISWPLLTGVSPRCQPSAIYSIALGFC